MNRVNVRTVNGAKHNGLLEPRYAQVRNREAAVLDAWANGDDGLSLDLVAILHHIPSKRIEQDLYGEPSDIKKRFGINSTTKLESTIRQCFKEISWT